MKKKNTYKLVLIYHLDYNLNVKYNKRYCFESDEENLRVGDVVLLDSTNGVTMGIVDEIVVDLARAVKIEEVKTAINYGLRSCKKMPRINGKEILEKDSLPF